jgi:hypothetical protein
MLTLSEIHDTTTNSVDFSLRDSFTEERTLHATFRSESPSSENMRVFLGALRATADELDDVFRQLAD